MLTDFDPHRILTSPLLEEEDEEGDDESNEVALSEESLLQTQSLPGCAFFLNCSLDFRHFMSHRVGVHALFPQVGKILESLVRTSSRGEPPRRFLRSEQAEAHDTFIKISRRQGSIVMIVPPGTSWRPNGIRQTLDPVGLCWLIPTEIRYRKYAPTET